MGIGCYYGKGRWVFVIGLREGYMGRLFRVGRWLRVRVRARVRARVRVRVRARVRVRVRVWVGGSLVKV